MPRQLSCFSLQFLIDGKAWKLETLNIQNNKNQINSLDQCFPNFFLMRSSLQWIFFTDGKRFHHQRNHHTVGYFNQFYAEIKPYLVRKYVLNRKCAALQNIIHCVHMCSHMSSFLRYLFLLIFSKLLAISKVLQLPRKWEYLSISAEKSSL